MKINITFSQNTISKASQIINSMLISGPKLWNSELANDNSNITNEKPYKINKIYTLESVNYN